MKAEGKDAGAAMAVLQAVKEAEAMDQVNRWARVAVVEAVKAAMAVLQAAGREAEEAMDQVGRWAKVAVAEAVKVAMADSPVGREAEAMDQARWVKVAVAEAVKVAMAVSQGVGREAKVDAKAVVIPRSG